MGIIAIHCYRCFTHYGVCYFFLLKSRKAASSNLISASLCYSVLFLFAHQLKIIASALLIHSFIERKSPHPASPLLCFLFTYLLELSLCLCSSSPFPLPGHNMKILLIATVTISHSPLCQIHDFQVTAKTC